MPKVVNVPVMNTLKPDAIPIVGPKINLTELEIYTRKYFKNSSVIIGVNNKSIDKVLI